MIYTRASDPSRAGSEERQERLCRTWASEQGLETIEVVSEGFASAWTGVTRPGFERLVGLIAAGAVDTVVVWRVDRLTRSPGDLERVLALCAQTGVELASVTEPVGAHDRSARAIARMLGIFAGIESDLRSARVRGQAQERARRGNPSPSGTYGVRSDGTGLIEAEADVVRDVARRVLTGESLTRIVTELDAAGVRSRANRPFSYAALRGLMMSPGLCGDRALRGQVVARDCWPAVLDRLTATRVRYALSWGTRESYARPASHELAGLVTCGSCGGRMVLTERSAPRPRYRCHHRLQCRQMSITQRHLEGWISTLVRTRLSARSHPANRTHWDSCDHDGAVTGLERGVEVLARLHRAHYVEAELTYLEWSRLRRELALEVARASALAGPWPVAQLAGLEVWEAPAQWDSLDVATRRELTALELHTVTVNPPVAGRWHDARAVPTWILPDPAGWVPAATPTYPVVNRYGVWELTANPRRRPRNARPGSEPR